MTNEVKAALARMQIKREARPIVWMNPNGTFSHYRDGKTEWADEVSCRYDLRLCRTWEAS